MSAGDLELDGRRIDCKEAVPRDEMAPGGKVRLSEMRVKKIFVGGLDSRTTEEDFKEYFSQFGDVTEGTTFCSRTHCPPRK